jgi:hypothetical protein
MRKASEAPFPYASKLVCYFEQRGSDLAQLGAKSEIRDAIRRARSGSSTIFAVWPGQWKSDLFVIDDLDRLAEGRDVAA